MRKPSKATQFDRLMKPIYTLIVGKIVENLRPYKGDFTEEEFQDCGEEVLNLIRDNRGTVTPYRNHEDDSEFLHEILETLGDHLDEKEIVRLTKKALKKGN